MKKTDLAYTAGIIDGEGWISIVKQAYHNAGRGDYLMLLVGVGSTDEWLCQWLKFAYGGKLYKQNPPISKLHYKAVWRWTKQGPKAREFLELITPYLHLKRPQAELAIKFQKRKSLSKRKEWQSNRILEEADKILLTSMHTK